MPAVKAGFFDLQSFELIQRISKAFCQSDLVPQQYRGQDKLPNCMIAMDMAQRIGANPLMVMQNLYIVHGTPGWSSKFLIATINACGRYSSLRYEWKGEPGTPDYGCRAWAVERESGERLDGIWVTWQMVKAEGWDSKNGSKWKTMPDQMFVYRAAAFWQRAYAPELGMGLQTVEDLNDAVTLEPQEDGTWTAQEPAVQAATPQSLRSKRGNLAQPANDAQDEELRQLEQRQPVTVPQQTRAAEPETIDAETGEIRQQREMPADGPGFEDAIAAARSGDFDTARDIASGLPEPQRQQIEVAIQNQQGGNTPAGARQRRERGQGGLSLE